MFRFFTSRSLRGFPSETDATPDRFIDRFGAGVARVVADDRDPDGGEG